MSHSFVTANTTAKSPNNRVDYNNRSDSHSPYKTASLPKIFSQVNVHVFFFS